MPIQTFGNSSDYLSYPNVKPTLDLNFAATKTLDPRITFTRASTGTYTGLDGLIKTARVNEPRFDHNPVTRESLGLLVEEQRTNLLLRSEEFDNASWTNSGSSVTQNAITAPDGSLTADLITESSNNEAHRVSQAYTFTSDLSYTISCYFKQASGSRFGFLNAADGAPGIVVNLSTGTFTTTAAGQSNVVGSVQVLSNGWFRCSVSWTNSLPITNSSIRVGLTSNSGAEVNYQGDGTSGIYVWGAQLEVGSFPTSYIPTTSAQVTRSTDVARITGTNFTSWYNPNASTMVNRFIKAETTNRFIMGLGYDLSNYAAVGYAGATNNFAYAQPVISSANSPNNSFTTGSRVTSAFAFDSSGGSVSINGSTPSFKAAVGAMPSGSNGYAVFGASPFGPSSIASGTHQRFIYYPVRLPDSQLRLLTQ